MFEPFQDQNPHFCGPQGRPGICHRYHRHACVKFLGLGLNFIMNLRNFYCEFVFLCVQDLDTTITVKFRIIIIIKKIAFLLIYPCKLTKGQDTISKVTQGQFTQPNFTQVLPSFTLFCRNLSFVIIYALLGKVFT